MTKQGIAIRAAFLLLVMLLGLLLFQSYNNYKLHANFTPLPLSYNPNQNVSSYTWGDFAVKVQGGFVKGKFREPGSGVDESLLIRSLSPQPVITVKNRSASKQQCSIRLENIALEDVLASKIKGAVVKSIDPHTALYTFSVDPKGKRTISLKERNRGEYFEFIILGDNRNGYQTFSNIISQINFIHPKFVIDNGDLVFGGEPNKYRLFNETVYKLQVPLYTTLGNHDIRENGRPLYTMLFGPPYYSFDYAGIHFVFLDSSRGWAEKQAIPDAEYEWLERDLKKAEGKRIFVISHIPPVDPRSNKKPNYLNGVPGIQETSALENIMDDYSAYKELDHGFQTAQEARRFEALMSKYKVDTVFLSHIHSYFSYIKGGVRYIISGGAGAELLTENSYYHYIRVKVTKDSKYLEVVELPSPPNQIQDRYLAAVQLFASSIYKEYTPYVWGIGILVGLFLLWVVVGTYKIWVPKLIFTGRWAAAVTKFAWEKYKEMKANG